MPGGDNLIDVFNIKAVVLLSRDCQSCYRKSPAGKLDELLHKRKPARNFYNLKFR